jgi:hypothetical protein
MDSPFKIGAISGLIAGIVAGIVAFFCIQIGPIIGLWEIVSPIGFWGILFPYSITKIIVIQIVMNAIWGALFGVIYSRFHKLIPVKGILKGFYFSMIFYLIAGPRTVSFVAIYGYLPWVLTHLFVAFFIFASYGLVLGALYRKWI